MLGTHPHDAPHPAQQRGLRALLRGDVHALIAVGRVHDQRKVERLLIGFGKAGVPAAIPLHRRAHTGPIAQEDVIAHPDLVAVVDDRRAWHREEQRVHQLDLAAAVVEQRREAAANADVDAHAGLARVLAIHVVALLVRHHLERELIMIAEEDRPLAVVGNRRRLRQNLDDRAAVLLADRHVHARHERKVKRHVAFLSIAEVRDHIARPLVRLGEQQLVLELRIERRANLAQHLVRLGKVLAVRAIALDEVGDRVQPHAVDAHLEPEAHHVDHCRAHFGIVEVEIGLVAEEAMPVELLGHRIPRPVRDLGVREDDARILVLGRIVGPDVPVPLR